MRLEILREDAGSRLDKLLCAKIEGLGRSAVKRLFSGGRVRVSKEGGTPRIASKGDVVAEGTVVHVELDASVRVVLDGRKGRGTVVKPKS